MSYSRNKVLSMSPDRYYPLDETAGDYDSLVGADSLSVASAPGIARGIDSPLGKAVSFEGTSQNDLIGTELLSGATAGSLSIWLKINPATQARQQIYGEGEHKSGSATTRFLLARNNTTGKYFGQMGDGTSVYSVGDNVVPSGGWQHLALTYDGAALKLYINGVEDGSTAAVSVTMNTGSLTHHVGSGFAIRDFLGQAAHAASWTRAITPEEVVSLSTINASSTLRRVKYGIGLGFMHGCRSGIRR